jgi:hypothetical protein
MHLRTTASGAAIALACGSAGAFNFETDYFSGSFNSTITTGIGLRLQNPSCDLVIQGAIGKGAPTGCLAPTSLLGDQGNLNYAKGDLFAGYIKDTSELLLKFPDDWRFMTRFSLLYDPAAVNTTGYVSAANPPGVGSLTSDAESELRFYPRLLDLWVSKSFQIDDQQARVRLGNQVVSWGESLFIPGGINATNAVDIQRLSQPGTQLKEAILPAPMISFATGLGHGVNVDLYYQFRWNASYFPPTGGYWSTVNGLGAGYQAYGLSSVDASNSGQWGASLRYQVQGTQLNLGFYALGYNDKLPQFSTNINGSGAVGWTYPENRQLYGISANFPVGDLAVGAELSYRPKDAVALNSNTGCASQAGNCWVDEAKYQFALTGLLSLTPSVGAPVLNALGASTATLLAEAVVISYPGLKRTYGGDAISAGGWGWGQETNPAASPVPVGDKTSWGFNFDFSWVYDGTLISGWQVVPEIYYFQAVGGRTPNIAATFMQGAKSVNLLLTFIQNPATWQFGVNYARFWGGSSPFDQPLGDRSYLGAYASFNF